MGEEEPALRRSHSAVTGGKVSSTLALALALSLSARAGELPTFEVQANGALGSAFVVKDFREGRGRRLLLITALHVVHGARKVEILPIECESTGESTPAPVAILEEGTEWWVWPELDLAAYEIPDAQRAAFVRTGDGPSVSATAGTVAFDRRIDDNALVHVLGKSSYAPCAVGVGLLIGQPTAASLAGHLARRHARTNSAAEVEEQTRLARGSLAPEFTLLQYFSPAHKGTSGAAVTLAGAPGVVVGVHNAGFENAQVSWAVALRGRGEMLRTGGTRVALGRAGWPEFLTPKLTQSDLDFTAAPSDIVRGRRMVREWGGIELLGGAEFLRGSDRTGPFVRAAYSHDLLRFPASTQSSALAARVSAGWRWSSLVGRLFGPDGTLLETQEDVGASGFTVGAELGLRLLRNASALRVDTSIGGRYARPSFVDPFRETRQDRGTFAGTATIRLHLLSLDLAAQSQVVPSSFVIEAGLLAGWFAAPTRRYTGVGAETTATFTEPGITFTAGGGVSW